ncbi:hypothetical protein CLOM_g9912, partial [Closterium sp. NIES-68]
MSGHP